MPYVEYKTTGGLNLRSAPEAIGDGELREAVGVSYDTDGAVDSLAGSSRVVATGSTTGILGAKDVTLGGTKYRLSKSGTTFYRNEANLGTLSGTGHISVVPYNDYAYIADGTSIKRYNTTTGLEAAGLAAPAAAPTEGAIVEGAGAPDWAGQDGIYKYVFTYYNGVAESNFSPSLTVDADISTHPNRDSIDLEDITAGPAGTTERRIYRTVAGGVSYFRVGTLSDNTTTTFSDPGGLVDETDGAAETDELTDEARREDTLATANWQRQRQYPSDTVRDDYDVSQVGTEVAQTNLGVLANWTDHDPPPTGLKHLQFLTETVYGIVGNSLRFSASRQPEHWSPYNDIPIGRQTGETLQAILPLGRDMVCYTDSGIYKFRRVGIDAAQSILEQATSPIGLAGEWAVAEVFVRGGQAAGHIFLASDGLYLFDGEQAVQISQKIDPLFTDPTQDEYIHPSSHATAVMASQRDRVWLSYSNVGSTTNNRTLIVDFQDPSNIRFAVLHAGYQTLYRETDGTLVGGDASGALWNLGPATGGSVEWAVRTKRYPLRGVTVMEQADRVIVDADLGGISTTAYVENDRGTVVQFTITGTGRQKYKKLLPITLRGNSLDFKLTSTGAARRRLYGVAFGYEEGQTP